MLWYMYFCALKPMGDNFPNILFKKIQKVCIGLFLWKIINKIYNFT